MFEYRYGALVVTYNDAHGGMAGQIGKEDGLELWFSGIFNVDALGEVEFPPEVHRSAYLAP